MRGRPSLVDELTAPSENVAPAGGKAADIGDSPPFVFVLRSTEYLGESDEKPFRPTEVTEPIRVLILDDFAYELRAAHAEPFKRLSMSSTVNTTRGSRAR